MKKTNHANKSEPEFTSPLNIEHRCQIQHCFCKDGQPIEQVVKPYKMRRAPFSITHRDIAAFWDYDKNCGWAPSDFSAGSHVVAWWKCSAAPDHLWSQTINLCCRMQGCPFCRGYKLSKETSLAKVNPKIAKGWHPTFNVCTPKDIAYNSNYVAWWLCRTCGFEFQMEVSLRQIRQHGCSRCAWGEPIDLTLYPEVLRLFDRARNKGIDPSDFSTNRFIWWKCDKAADHLWQERFEKRTAGKTCPFCAGYRASSTNNLNKIPEIAAQFHPTKNGAMNPEGYTVNSTSIVWWQCPVAPDHVWRQRIRIRTIGGYGCPFCSNKKLSKSNCLKTLFPKVARDWHPVKNKKLTPSDVLAGSAKEVWWQCCKCKYEWKRAIYLRTNKHSPCPACRQKIEGNKRDLRSGRWLPADGGK